MLEGVNKTTDRRRSRTDRQSVSGLVSRLLASEFCICNQCAVKLHRACH